MKEKQYVEDFEYYPMMKHMYMYHSHYYMKNKLYYLIFD
jgi:hypothetical protein